MTPSSGIARLLILSAYVAVLLSGKALPRGSARPCLDQTPAARSVRSVRYDEPTPGYRTGSITGRVLTDSGRPLAGAAVDVRRTGPNQTILTVMTDDEGRFVTEELQAGGYLITVSAPGYVSLNRTPDHIESAVYRPGDSVTITLFKGGVITGKVTDVRGAPVVALSVRAIRVHDTDGEPVLASSSLYEGQTDDRGVYRIYGLVPGAYIVAAGGASLPRRTTNLYEYDAPSFYPSGTRDAAAEVAVELGAEVSGIDVRYRGEPGYAISGAATGLPAGSTLMFTLNYAGSNVTLASTMAASKNEKQTFAFYGIPEGEYNLVALGAHHASHASALAVRHIVVKGSDVTALTISLTQLGSISGRIQFEHNTAAGQACQAGTDATPTAIPLWARLDEKKGSGKTPQDTALQGAGSDVSNESGEFALTNLVSGLYRGESQLPAKELYVRSITYMPGVPASGSKGSLDVARNGLMVKPGEKINGVSVTLTDGAAALQGSVTAKENLSAQTRIYLVPAEREAADEVLRYAEAPLAADGTFALTNLAPGRYWILARRTLGQADPRL